MTPNEIERCLREEKSYVNFADEIGVTYAKFVQYMRKFDMKLIFRHSEIQKELNEYFRRNTLQDLAKAINLTNETLYVTRKNGRCSYRMMIQLLNYFNVNYEVVLKPNNSKGLWCDYPIQFPMKRDYVKRNNKGEKDTVSIPIYSHLLSQFNRKLQILMNEKGIGDITQSRINEVVFDIIKEAVQIGIHAERNKTEQKILETIYKSIRENKIVEYRRESL